MPSVPHNVLISEIAKLLFKSERVLFITGAGVSADSGLPTYRGIGGLYNGVDTDEGIPIEDALSGDCLRVRPEITWKYLNQIQRNCERVGPNDAHKLISALESHCHVAVLTQNIDGLHSLAGSRNVIEIHGTLAARHCVACDAPADANMPMSASGYPQCPFCGGVVRADVVLYGESLPAGALDHLYDELALGFDMVFVIGTTAVFPYIAEPVLRAIRNRVPTVEINPAKTRLSDQVAYYLPVGAGGAMREIFRALGEMKEASSD